MTGREFIKAVRKWARRRGIAVQLDTDHGKGSHATLHVGNRRTTIKYRRKEIGTSLLHAMCKQPGIDPDDL